MHYLEHLSKDKRLLSLIDKIGKLSLKRRYDVFSYLCASIMSQQLSTKVATVIYNRFLALYEGKAPTARKLLDTPIELLRSIGLSRPKANYIKNVAEFHLERGIEYKKLSSMSNEEVIAYLTQIKGVGRWTVEMLLMFALKREDVFPIDDLGIQQAMIQLYQIKYEHKKELYEKMRKIAQRWSPYRTYACLYLWEWKDNGAQ